MQFFISITMSGVKAAITDHFEMFFRDMADEPFDEINDRNGFLNILFIFVAVIMKSTEITQEPDYEAALKAVK